MHVGHAAVGAGLGRRQWAARRTRAERALERLGDEEVSGGLGGEGVRWRKGGCLRRLGVDERLLHDRLRWLGLSARPWTSEAAAAWARESGVRTEEVVERRETEDGEEETVTLADGVASVSAADSLTWAWGSEGRSAVRWPGGPA